MGRSGRARAGRGRSARGRTRARAPAQSPPRDSAADALQALLDAGWTTDGIVTLSQLVAFLASSSASSRASPFSRRRSRHGDRRSTCRRAASSATHDAPSPNAFTQAELGWLPWLEPMAVEELTERHYDGPRRHGTRRASPYFRLLVRDPEILGARTRADNDIFYNARGPAARGARALGGRRVAHERLPLLRLGALPLRRALLEAAATTCSAARRTVSQTDLGERWNAVTDAAAALTATPIAFGRRARRRAPRGRPRRPGDRRRRARRGVLQLGEPAHALPRRTDTAVA